MKDFDDFSLPSAEMMVMDRRGILIPFNYISEEEFFDLFGKSKEDYLILLEMSSFEGIENESA